jgi:hypothetical protein
MLDPGWEKVAARTHAWLEETLDRGEPMDEPPAFLPYGSMRSLDAAERNPG